MSSGKHKLAAIIVCGDPIVLSIWLKTTFLELARNENVRIIIVPWGDQCKAIFTSIPKSIEVCEPSKDTTLESNRNEALKRLRGNPPELVAFLDDDTFLNPSWVDAMIASVETHKDTDAFASVVFSEGWSEMQGQGHVFIKGGPRDRGYRGKNLDRPVLCPCGNSAVVRWQALERIWQVDDQAWDPVFNQDQTCFDFGLKLFLTGTRTFVVPGAVSRHRGYLSKDASWRKKHGKRKVTRQLAARYLLYKKFLPDALLNAAVAAVESRLPKWREEGYPGFEEAVIGETVDQINSEAQKRADELATRIKCHTWPSITANFKSAWELFDLTNDEAMPPN